MTYEKKTPTELVEFKRAGQHNQGESPIPQAREGNGQVGLPDGPAQDGLVP